MEPNDLTCTASLWQQWSPAARATGYFLTDVDRQQVWHSVWLWAGHPSAHPPVPALRQWALDAIVADARSSLSTRCPEMSRLQADEDAAADEGRGACIELLTLVERTGLAATRELLTVTAQWWQARRKAVPQALTVEAVESLLARCCDQLAALLVFSRLAEEEERGRGWSAVMTRVSEHIVLPGLGPVVWRVAAEHHDRVQACIAAMYDRARTKDKKHRFTYRSLAAAYTYFTSTTFGYVVLRMLTPPPPKTAAQPGASVTPVAALPPTLEDPEEVAARQHEVAMTWAQTQRACPTRKTAIQAWFLSYWRDDRHYKVHDIAAELGQPACGQLLDQLDESEWPPGVSRQEAQHALHDMTEDAIRQIFSRYDKDLVLIRWPTKPKLPMWKCMVSRLGEQEAVRFWTLMQLIEDRTSNLDPDSVAEIVQRFAALGRQGGPASARGGAPPDARVHEQHRPPRVSWASVAQAFGQLRPEMLSAEALYNRYATFWTHVVSTLQQAR